MNTRYAISLLVAGALAFACGPRSRSESGALAIAHSATNRALTGKSADHQRSTSGSKQTKLDARLEVAVAKPTEVQFAFNVTNVGNKHIELSFPSGKSYDIVVVDSVGREVWQWSNGRIFTQGVQNKQLGTGDSMKVKEAWSNPAPGTYTAIAQLNSSNFPVEQRVDFVIP